MIRSLKIVVIVAQAAVLIAALVALVLLDILGQDGTRHGTHKRRMNFLIMVDVLTLIFQVSYLIVVRAIRRPTSGFLTQSAIVCHFDHLSMLNGRQISHGHGVEKTTSKTKPSPTPVRFNVAATQSPLNIEVSRTVVQDNIKKNRYTGQVEWPSIRLSFYPELSA
ncbi:hypothetical protein CPB85DRAFT_1296332 [Mucidula mucida]|nr:hypothetical protein CPB85DRAFT_1296332 [Mucidula mucida]